MNLFVLRGGMFVRSQPFVSFMPSSCMAAQAVREMGRSSRDGRDFVRMQESRRYEV